MSEQENNFDEEFHKVFTELKELRKSVESLNEALTSLEKRMLLRVRGNQYCRVCQCPAGSTLNPPISEWELKYHESNHATFLPPDPSRRLPALPTTVDWDALERSLANFKKVSG